MAIVKMKKLRLLAMRTDQERLLHQLQLFGNVEVSEQPVDSTDPEWAGLLKKNEAALSEKKAAVTRAANALSVLDQYAYVKTSFFAVPRQVGEDDLFDQALPVEAQDKIGKIEDAQARLSGLYTAQGRAENELRSLQLWLPLDVPLDVQDTAHVAFRFGTVPATSDMAAVQAALLAATESCALYEAGRDREQIGVFLIYYAQEEQALEQALRAVAFSPVHWPGYTGSAKENAAALERRLDETREQISATRKELEACGTYRETIQLYLERARQDLASEEAKAELLHTETAFSLTGWVPAEQEEQLLALLRQYDCAWELSEPEEAEYPDVPVKLKNNRFTRALNMVTEMYSLPAYDGVDPNPLMAPFFILFYGVMLADMGYGLLMILAAIVVKAKKKPQGGTRNFFDLMLYCGISTFVVGLLTGGFFGDAPLQVARILNPDTTWQGLPALFNPLDDTVMILLGSMALGFIHIITGMAISVVEKLKAGQVMDAIWGEITWWVVFAGIALMALGVGNVNGIPVVLCLGGVMILIGSGWDKKGFGKVTAVFSSLYSNITGYFGDILSYSRLMALMLAGSVIAQVFNTIGAIFGNIVIFLIIAVIGNALNFALNLLGCYVHDLRLQCLEFFGKFYKDGGRPFHPLAVNTKYVRFVNK